MARGKVQNWNGQTGFLIDEADGLRVFFGDRALRGLTPLDIRPGMDLEFDRGEGEKGPRASNVRRAGDGKSAPPVGKLRPAVAAGHVPEPPEEIVLPRSTQAVIRQVPLGERHPGLQLDRLVIPGDQVRQHAALRDVTQVRGDRALFEEVRLRRRASLQSLGVTPFERTTAAPLTLHLARANALENAGICLHRVYGFPYLPGSGLKGMARAYAETVASARAEDVEAVFGNAPGEPRKDHQRAGSIVFHDAWPTSWPSLVVDIVNNHHPQYYRGEDAPGDWDSPNPVYFLALPGGTTFEFALGKRRTDVPDRLLKQAHDWLDGALTHLGCGAKTVAGYGTFQPTNDRSAATMPAVRAAFAATLDLATPAFLAGAAQKPEDCDLRSATLRGLLRWWWRAMHVGYVDILTLRQMEAALWGDTEAGGAVRLEVRSLGKVEAVLYDKQAEARRNALPRPPDKKTTQGLWYHSYGMNDGGKQRCYVPAGTRWALVLHARQARFARKDRNGKPLPGSSRAIDKEIVLEQAKAALWWLCALGGVGSKSRKGFGNLRNPPELDEFFGARFVSLGKKLREACGLPDEGFRGERTDSPALRQMVDLGRKVRSEGNGWIEGRVSTGNVWQALDAVGMAAQLFAKHYKHQRAKCALGLPRRIGNPAQGQFRPGQGVGDRHSSPVHYHLHPEGDDFVLRVAAFPASRLPNLKDSETILQDLLTHLVNSF